MKFPQVTSNSLNKTEYAIPQDLRGEYNVVIVAFLRWHQRDVNTWLPLLDQVEQTTKQRVSYYELPTVRRGNPMFRFYLDNVMRGGIQDTDTRERTITLYLDVEKFCNQLQISPDTIHTYLLSAEGEILYHEPGGYRQDKGEKLLDLLHELLDEKTIDNNIV